MHSSTNNQVNIFHFPQMMVTAQDRFGAQFSFFGSELKITFQTLEGYTFLNMFKTQTAVHVF